MKKLLLISVLAMAGLSASAQFNSKSSGIPQTTTKVVNVPQSQRTYQAVAPRQDLGIRSYVPLGDKLTLNPAKVKPVTNVQRTSVVSLSAIQTEAKAFSKGKVQNRNMKNLRPTLTLNPQVTKQAKAARKAPAFAEEYHGRGGDYALKETVEWTMTPTTATKIDPETEEESEVDVLMDVIPTPDFLSDLYPNGFPIEYAIDEDGVITIMPQAIAAYYDEELDVQVFITLFSANNDAEDGTITMQLEEGGKLKITDGNLICLGEFAGVEFDEEMGDGEAYLGWDELITDVNYYYHLETTIDKEYNAHGVDYFANEAVDWVMQRGTTKMDDEAYQFFVNMTPLIETFSEIFPNGIDVACEQIGETIIVKPQVIASISDEEGTEYILLCSGTADDGNIVLVEDQYGLKTIDGETIIIGAWSTNKFDPSFDTYLGSYSYIEKIKYRTSDAPAEAPSDVACEPNELVLFAGLGYSGYSYTDNLAMMGAYAPTTFRNATLDIVTDFEWTAKEIDSDDVETTITSNDRHFCINAKGGATYEDFSLIAYNQGAVSEPYTWGTGHCLNNDETGPRYEAIHVYAGQGASAFEFTDGTYAVMTRQNPDYDLTFYVNWATPDIADNYGVASMSTIYSYQGKPATPLYFTGVTLPLVSFEAYEDFNLHIKICKCKRSSKGNLQLGDVIAEGDATEENVVTDYDAGIKAVEFTELYKEDEFGMSETVDYLFIEDEFVIVIEGWDNGTFSGVLGSQQYNYNEITSTWFERTNEPGRLRAYGGGWPMLFIGLLDATYGYLYTEDDPNLIFAKEGGSSSIHVSPMYYTHDDETGEPTYLLDIESVTENGEEVGEIPEWITLTVANEDYTTATEVDEDGEEYTYFVNGIDYDLVVDVDALPEGLENRTAQFVFFQTGAKLTVTITQDVDPDGISTVVEKTPIKNGRAFNLAGQPVGKNYKGIVVKDGKCVLVK